MTLETMVLGAVRGAVILAVVLVALRVLARSAAAARRSVLVGGFLIVIALPIASAVLPAVHVRGEARPAAVPAHPSASAVPDSIVDATASEMAASTHEPVDVRVEAGRAGESTSIVSPLAIVVALWALGAVVVLARLGIGIVRARRLVRGARFVETLDVGGRPVQVRISKTIETPAVTGLLDAVVLLPHEAESWTAERRRIVLAHELAHVTSHDCLVSVLAQVAVAMHWFDPLVWIAARRLRMERELAADDRVLEQGVLASTYAEHLLALATSQRAVPAGVLAMAERSHVADRIRAVLAARRGRPSGRARLAMATGSLAFATLIACATPDREPAPAPVNEPSKSDTRAVTTIDPKIQAIAEDEIERMNQEWSPCAAIVLVLDPRTGNVVAASYRGGTESTAERAAARPMRPGSTLKPLVVAAALEEGVIGPADRFDATPEPLATIVDSTPHGMLDVGEILAVSSNVGLVRISDKLGNAKLAAWIKRFHFAAAPSTITGAADGAALAIGAKLSTTPLEMAAAFATLANGGVYHAPTFVPRTDSGERIVRPETSAAVLALLEGVTGEHGTGTAARVQGVRVAGKTGTVHLGTSAGSNDYYSSFVGTAPLDQPRYVVFVGAETPRDGGTGGQVAAPVFGRIMSRLLAP